MSVSTFVTILLNGISIGMLLFLVAVGLTLIFGLMDVINLSHGSLFMLGGYISFSVMTWTGSFPLAVVTAAVALAVCGLLIEPLFLRPFYGRALTRVAATRHLDQVLVTLGLIYVISDSILWIWGPQIRSVSFPDRLSGSVQILNITYPSYRLFVAGFGLAVFFLLLFLERRTLYGAILRAGTRDPEMVSAVGINIKLVFWLMFGFGALLAGTGGAMGAPILGLAPGVDVPILITSLVIIVVGGIGSLAGSFWGSLLIGVAQSFGGWLIPTFSLFLVYALMVAVLLIRPQGLFGGESIRQ